MTQAPQIPITAHALSGSDAGPWPTSWTYADPVEVAVFIRQAGGAGEAVDSGDVTVTGATPLVDGGSVEISAALVPDEGWPAGSYVYLVRTTPTGQTAAIAGAGSVPLGAIEQALDRLSRQIQDQDVEIARGLKVPLGDSIGDLPGVIERAGTVLTFDTFGNPDASKTYEQFVLDVSTTVTDDELLIALETEGAEQRAEIVTTGGNQVAAVEAEGAAQALALGLPIGMIDFVSPLAGKLAGWAYTDFNGWTTADLHTAPTGEIGKVMRIKHPTIDLSGQPGAYRIAEPGMSADYSIYLIFHQSGGEDADAVPMLDRTGHRGSVMLDTNRPRFWAGPAYGSTFTTALTAEYVDGSNNHWGGDKADVFGRTLQELITAHTGLEVEIHEKRIIPIYAGRSSTWVTSIGPGSDTMNAVKTLLTAIKAACDAAGKTVRIIGQGHQGGEQAYVDGLSVATIKSDLTAFYGPTGHVLNEYYSIFEQSEVERTYCLASHAHHPRASYTDPRVAEAEVQLTEETDWFKVITATGHFMFGGERRASSASSTHPANYEQARHGFAYAVALFTEKIKNEQLFVPIPTFAKVSDTRIEATFADWPSGAFGSVRGTSLYPTGMQVDYGWFFCDPATPATRLTLTRVWWDEPKLIFDFAATLPASVTVRHGASASGSGALPGNMTIEYPAPLTFDLDGATYDFFHSIPALNRSVT